MNRIDGGDISVDMVKTVIIKDVTSVLDPEESTYHATVDYAKDELPENNASAKNEVKILLPDYPVPTALKATTAGNYVNLAWTAPDLLNRKPKVTEESFEDYKTFSIDGVGGWTMYDGDTPMLASRWLSRCSTQRRLASRSRHGKHTQATRCS